MTAPERIFIAGGWGEYGNYYPEAVEAEGEHGGRAIEYTRADIAAAEREALFAALDPIIHDLKTAAAIGYTLVDFSTEETEHVDALTEVHTAYIDALQRYMKLRGKS